MRKTKFPAVLSTFIVSYIFWLLLTWPFGAGKTELMEELIAGAVVCLAIALFSAKFFVHEKAGRLFIPKRLAALLAYIFGVFFPELFKANFAMAKLCYGGCKKVAPGIVKIPVGLESEYAQAMLANSITLTPGTITMDVAEEDGQTYYYVHWICAGSNSEQDAGEVIKGKLERGIRRIFP